MTGVNQRLGEVLRDGERVGVRYERALAHPPAKVWSALTESEHLRHWFPADILGERRAGAEIRFRFWPETVDYADTELAEAGVDLDDPELPGRILTWDPPRIFELLWDDEHLRFEIVADGPGSRLLSTIWFGKPGPHGLPGTAAGYHFCLDALADSLDNQPTALPDPEVVAELERRYAELIGTP
ncbi:SRPBCC domain-containing protein [Nocardia sp. XZ_19_385]|uniref:SRPBCC domain-containing protein n=1 Tax=Nocardia sp. XZ_19_385 TaxID=2769488 RepID=UPI00188F96F3|nr:SRPBCC domain-containing protein [Nocardia sp. XZ_19_385]